MTKQFTKHWITKIIAAMLVVASIDGLLSGCAHRGPGDLYVERGLASWYGPGFQGKRTASGERFDMHSLTAAHRTLPLGTWAEVKSLSSGRTISVRINDRGPYTNGKIIDLSYRAAKELGMLKKGSEAVEVRGTMTAPVQDQILSRSDPVPIGPADSEQRQPARSQDP